MTCTLTYISAFSAFLVIFAMDFPGHNLGLRHATRHGSLVYLLDDLPGTRICGTRNLVPTSRFKETVPLRDLCPRNTASAFPNQKTTSSHWQSLAAQRASNKVRWAAQTLQRHGGVGFFWYERATPCPYTFRLALGCGKQLLAPFCNAEARPESMTVPLPPVKIHSLAALDLWKVAIGFIPSIIKMFQP